MSAADTTRLQRVLAVLGFTAFIAVFVADGLAWYSANELLSGILMIAVLAFAGFGWLVQIWLESR